MREILFKAKTKNADGTFDWVEGHLSMCDGKWIICDDEGSGDFIDPETICQYTGLKDKHGKKIFEGDVVKHYNWHDMPEYYTTGKIFWDASRSSFRRTSNMDKGTANIAFNCVYEVIGNIFDNAELLEE